MYLEGTRLALNLLKLSNPSTDYDVTIFQTPNIGEKKGYRPVYRLTVRAKNHQEVLKKIFRKFNISEAIPPDYNGRYIWTGDIVFIDEGKNGTKYYKLVTGGWEKIHRIHVR